MARSFFSAKDVIDAIADFIRAKDKEATEAAANKSNNDRRNIGYPFGGMFALGNMPYDDGAEGDEHVEKKESEKLLDIAISRLDAYVSLRAAKTFQEMVERAESEQPARHDGWHPLYPDRR